jgi:hypothetical protein
MLTFMDPDKPAEPNRDKNIIFRVTAAEKAEIYANAAAAGYKKHSEYLRELGLKKVVQPRKPPEERRALVGIANNLNQVARRINSDHAEQEWGPMLRLMLKRLDEYFTE